MNYKTPKKLAVIQDMAGIGRCSLSVALPIISACHVQACPMPTALFSNHTGFPTYYKHDFTPYIPDYLDAWKKLDQHFDGIYCGYLGSSAQMELISSYIKEEKSLLPGTRIMIDPVFGDHRQLYHGLSDDYVSAMRSFIHSADLITPNLTEACFLTGTPFCETECSSSVLYALGERLCALGPSKIVITGIRDGDFFVNFTFDAEHGTSDSCRVPVSGSSRPGTGDIFASIVAAKLLAGIPLSECVKTAADFIAACTKASDEACVPVRDGVIFEHFLSLLATSGHDLY